MTLFHAQLWIDSANMGGMAMFINHSCDPNCILQRWEVGGLPHMCFFAIKNIKEGDELIFYQNWECDKDKKKTECKCGTATCRGFIEKLKPKNKKGNKK